MALEIIGPGFGRTGTNSLKLALEQLGFGPCHHMYEVRDNPERLADWQAASRGEAVDWDHVFRGYRSQVDWPGARYWRELARDFPDARVVLTVRDPDEWFDSVQRTIAPFLAARGKHATDHSNAIAHMAHETIALQIFDDRLTDREHATRIFREHIASVRSEIPAGRLLTLDMADGWEPLCAFLRVDVPDAPFPRTNSSRDFVEAQWKRGEVTAAPPQQGGPAPPT